MNWTRVKTILIIVFFMVNIFLVIKIIDKNSRKDIKPEEIQYLEHLLSKNNISLKVPIPSKINLMPRIKVTVQPENVLADRIIGEGKWTKKTGKNGETIYFAVNKEIRFSKGVFFEYKIKENPDKLKRLNREDKAKEYIYGILKKYVSLDDYELESAAKEENGYRIKIKNFYKGSEIFNNHIDVRIYNSGEIIITQGLVYIEGFTKAKKKTGCTDALIEFIRNASQNEPVLIKEILLGYYADFNKNGENIKYSESDPAWKIETNEGIYFLNGYNGALISKNIN